MKPPERSLDIAVIGLGQGGGNLAAEFGRRGYRALALNTARTDLKALGEHRTSALSEAQRLYIGIDGYDGAGADMNYGRLCVAESAERLREAAARHAEGADVVILTAGLGGGTGSAVSELVKALDVLELPIATLTTLPGAEESGIAKVNAVRAVSELVKIPDLGMIFADNARLAELHGNVTLDEYFERINEVIVDPIDALNQLNQRDELQPIRTLDGEDLRTLLMSTGVVHCGQGQLDGLSVDSVTEWVSNNLSASSVMPAGFAIKDIAYLGLVVEASGDLLHQTPFTFFNEISEHLKKATSGAGIYLGVYRNDTMPTREARLRSLASTPSLPQGIQNIVGEAQREGHALREKLSRSVGNLELGDIAELDLLPARSASSPPAGGGSGGGRRRARPSRRAQAQANRSQLSTPSMAPAAASPRRAKPKAEPSSPDGGGESGDKSEPETYDRLVNAFLNTDSESIRRRIATRLHTSRNSEHPLARFYANRAIERLVDAGEEEALHTAMGSPSAE